MPVPVNQSTGSLVKTLPRAKAPVMNLGPAKPPPVIASKNLGPAVSPRIASKNLGPARPSGSVRGSKAYKGKYGVKY